MTFKELVEFMNICLAACPEIADEQITSDIFEDGTIFKQYEEVACNSSNLEEFADGFFKMIDPE